jgi:hypothetical protein
LLDKTFNRLKMIKTLDVKSYVMNIILTLTSQIQRERYLKFIGADKPMRTSANVTNCRVILKLSPFKPKIEQCLSGLIFIS